MSDTVPVVDDNGIRSAAGIQVSSPDVPLVCPMTGNSQQTPVVFPAPLHPITEPITGFAFNIYNNIWETNWIFWYPYNPQDANLKARFAVDFGDMELAMERSVRRHGARWEYDRL